MNEAIVPMREYEPTEQMANARAIFLSPHYDDVVLSCGGTVALADRRGERPMVITIFGGEVPDEIITDFAKWKHGRWGAKDVEDIILRRQEEDWNAMRTLGARSRWLGYPDAIYRGDRYLSDPSLFGTPQAVEIGLVDLIAAELRHLPEWDERATVYVPLGIGEHVDHQLVFAVGQCLAACGIRVLAYEDCPYAMHTPTGVDRRLAEIVQEVGEEMHTSIAATLGQRIAAISAYRTQVPVIFRFTTDVPGTVAAFAKRTGGALGPAERFWPVLPAASSACDNVADRSP